MKTKRRTRNSWLLTVVAFLATATSVWASTEQLIHDFGSFSFDGGQPVMGLTRDAAGNLYGTTYVGGDFNGGTVFELSPLPGGGWSYRRLHSFGSGPDDGGGPLGRLALDAAGNIYGTTFAGGNGGKANGIAFELSPSRSGNWTETVLHTFAGGPAGSTDGGFPEGGVILDANGDLYGTTSAGGSAGLGW